MKSKIIIKNVSKVFKNKFKALENINLEIKENEFFVIMGLSGSGKSTLIRLINGLLKLSFGSITISGKDISNFSKKEMINLRRNTVSMVFQNFALFPHFTIHENISFGLKIRGESNKEINEKVFYWLKKVGLEGKENLYPRELSGGMQQRVGLARALSLETDIILMDEPFSALDPIIRNEMHGIMLELKKTMNKTFVFVTHDFSEAVKLSDRIAFLKDGEVIQVGNSEDILNNAEKDYVQKFVDNLKGF